MAKAKQDQRSLVPRLRFRAATRKHNEFLAELGLPLLPEADDRNASGRKK
jgi:hypothetical protein